MYELKDIPMSSTSSSNNDIYITREEFDNVISQLRQALNNFKPIEQVATQQAPSHKVETEYKF